MNYKLTNRKELKSKNYSAPSKDISKERRGKSLSLIKKGIWLYFLFLVFEGALRKWFLPGLATPLLVVRDPIAIGIIFLCIQRGIFKLNPYIAIMWMISFAAYCVTMIAGHGNLIVALYGVRILALHFPLIFVIGWVFDKEDVVKMGKVILWITIPMTILMTMQFYSPQSAWVNWGVGGDDRGAGFTGALGFSRPPGTFSFTNGLTLFYGLASGFIFYFWLDSKSSIKKWLLILTSICLIVAIPFSISRALFFQVIISVIFSLVIVSTKPQHLIKVLLVASGIAILLLALSNLSFFQTSIDVFTNRFDKANETEGGFEGIFLDRFLGGTIASITDTEDIPFWGRGLGLGTNVGSMLLKGNVTYLISEGEWGRLVGEQGLLLGLSVIGLRTMLGFEMILNSFRVIRAGNFLPWLLLSFSFLNILQGQWGQPTALGFAVLSGGLVLASYKLHD